MKDTDRYDRGFLRNRLLVHVDKLTPPGRALIARALDLAEEVHGNHYRKSRRDSEQKVPFIVHPMRVALILIEELNVTRSEAIAAALLHDVVEDSDFKITTHDLEVKFGRNVALVVSIITRPAPDRAISREQQLETYHGRIKKGNTYSRIIKLVERLDNLRDLLDVDDFDFQSEYLAQTVEIYLPIAENIEARLNSSLLSACRQLEARLSAPGSSSATSSVH